MPVHPYIPITNGAQVDLVGEQASQVTVNTMYFTHSGGFIDLDMITLGEQIIDWWRTNLAPLLVPAFTLNLVRVTDRRTSSGQVLEVTTGLPDSGSSAVTATMPMNATLSMSFRTFKRGRSYRGRNYIPGLPDDRDADNTLDDTLVAALIAAYNLIPSYVNPVDWDHVVASFFQEGDWLATAVTTPVESYHADANIDSQRRRLTGRGS